MNDILKMMTRFLLIISLGLMVVAGGLYLSGIRINTSCSIPRGVYQMSQEALVKGKYVLFCPPQQPFFEEARRRGYIGSGFCPGGYGAMMKKVMATQGNVVLITSQGVWVNGILLPHSQPLLRDGHGRPLPRIHDQQYQLGSSELLLMSDVSDTSFDSRYFGPVDQAQIQAVVRPLLVWE